jgi:hypothetical protein
VDLRRRAHNFEVAVIRVHLVASVVSSGESLLSWVSSDLISHTLDTAEDKLTVCHMMIK